MSQDVITVENVAAPVAPEPTSFAEVQKSWTFDEKTHWDRTGEEPTPKEAPPTATPEKEPDVPEPLPVKAEAKPEEGTGEEDQDHEPDYYGTPEQVKAQKKAFARVNRQKAELKAELKLLREQHAVKPAETAPAPKAEVKSQPEVTDAPEMPNMEDFATAPEYTAALKAWRREDLKWQRQQYETLVDSKVQALSASSAAERDEAKFEARKEARGITKSDYFSDDFPSSIAMNHVIRYDADGLDFVPVLTRENSERIRAMTDIPGFNELLVQNRERALYLLGEARTIAKYEMKLLSKPAETGPKPITKTAAPAPGTRVSANTSTVGDPLAQAEANYDKTGDHKYLREMNRIKDERDKARFRDAR